ncbi:MAG: hypothetical protein D4R82_01820 [Dehalococcoidia bacterium]|nr:MAG: hypothetical protein D4R82_01820 [Dehalococcoidia bacterium]
MVLNEVESSKILGREAAWVLGLSLRHAGRTLAAQSFHLTFTSLFVKTLTHLPAQIQRAGK